MGYEEKINELKELLKSAGYDKYLNDFARVLYKYIKDSDVVNESDLKAALESIATELDFSLTKSELLKQFGDLVRERISVNFVNRSAKDLSEIDFLYQERKHLRDLIEKLKIEFEFCKDEERSEELFKQIQEYERELARIESEIRKLEEKRARRYARNGAKNNAKRKSEKKIVIKREAKPRGVVVVAKHDYYGTQEFGYFLSRIREIEREVNELRKKLEMLEKKPPTGDVELKLNEIKRDVDYLKGELLNVFNAIALAKEEKKEEEKKREGFFKRVVRKITWRKVLIGVLLGISSPFLVVGYGVCMLMLPLIAIFLSPLILVMLIKILMLKYSKGDGE